LVVVVELSSYSLFSMLVNICIKICLHVDICIVITDCLSVFSGKQVPYPRVSTHELLLSALLNIGKARRTSAWYGQPFFARITLLGWCCRMYCLKKHCMTLLISRELGLKL
jgi:hypothetical protein